MQSKTQRVKAAKRVLRQMPKSGCFVYTLSTERDGIPVYVGQTRCPLDIRLARHLKTAVDRAAAGESLSPVQAWIIETIDSGRLPVIRMLDDRATWDITEAVWIDRYSRKGFQILNVSARVG